MKSLKRQELALLLVGSLTAATPVNAQPGMDAGGADEAPFYSANSGGSDDGTGGTGGTGGTAGTASTSCSAANPSRKCSFTASIDSPVIKGSYKKIFRRGGAKQNLLIKTSIGRKGDLVTKENFDNDVGVVRAIFPDGVACEFEGVSKTRRFFNYTLNIKIVNGVYTERRGFCTPAVMPSDTVGNSIIIEFDVDDDVLTPNTEIARIGF